MNNNLKKNFIWNSIGALINSASSLFFLIIVTRINGTDTAGVFTFAFSTACILYIVGTYSGRTYQVTEPRKEISNSDYFYTRIITSSLMLIMAIIFSLLKGYSFNKSLIIFSLVLYKAIESIFDVLYGVFQKNNDLYKVGISLFIKALAQVSIFALINLITKDILLSISGLIISNLIVFIIYDLVNLKQYKSRLKNININHVMYILRFGFWTFLFTFLTQYLLNAPKYAIDNLLNNDSQTIYGIISMPATVMFLASQFLVQPFLNDFSNNIKNKQYKIFNSMIIKLIGSILVIGIVVIIGSYLVGIPFLELIYSVKLNDYLNALLVIMTGSTLYGITCILSCGLITMRKTLVQSIIFGIVSVVSFFVSNSLVNQYGVFGASLSYLLSMSLLIVLYSVVYFVEYNKLKK